MSPGLLDLRDESRALRPKVSDHPTEIRASAVRTWRARMVNEYLSSEVFDALSNQFSVAGFDRELTAELAQFADEERRHGILCGAVVEALGAAAIAPVSLRQPFPLHLDTSPRAAALRNVVHVCCMSETVAVSLIGAERLEMPEGALRDLLTTIYSDEVGHARFGWRLLESVGDKLDPHERRAVEQYLPRALAHLEAHELAHLPDCEAPASGELLGLCSGRQARVLMRDTLEQVIRPGLRRWFAC